MVDTAPEAAPTSGVPAKPPRWTYQWQELKAEVIDTGLCTGCAGCVIACPHDVIGYDHAQGGYRPFHLEDELGPDDCIHGQKGCTSCPRPTSTCLHANAPTTRSPASTRTSC